MRALASVLVAACLQDMVDMQRGRLSNTTNTTGIDPSSKFAGTGPGSSSGCSGSAEADAPEGADAGAEDGGSDEAQHEESQQE